MMKLLMFAFFLCVEYHSTQAMLSYQAAGNYDYSYTKSCP